jgi:outer membrane protein assembly factor BamA
VLTQSGDRLLLVGEVGGSWLGGSYDYLRVQARYEWWIPLAERHTLSLHLGAGLILGDSPRFDQFYVGDVNPLLPPRVLDLIVSTRPQWDLLGSGANLISAGDLYGAFAVEYAFRLFSHKRRPIYGGDLFFGVGVYGLGKPEEDVGAGFPLDLTFNAGVRLDTEIGVFELSIDNAVGRLPF